MALSFEYIWHFIFCIASCVNGLLSLSSYFIMDSTRENYELFLSSPAASGFCTINVSAGKKIGQKSKIYHFD